MKRPPLDPSLSREAKACLTPLLDTIVALERTFEAIYEVEAKGKPTRAANRPDATGISRPVEDEVLAKARYWEGLKTSARSLRQARAAAEEADRLLGRLAQGSCNAPE